MTSLTDNPFHQWIRLEQPRLGSQVVFATDDFFADKTRLIDPAEPVFVPDKFDDHGKWMDGWESRRKRTSGHDYCVVRLGVPGFIRGLDIDTRHFTGNFPPAASVEACVSSEELPGENTEWQEILQRVSLEGDSHHFMDVSDEQVFTHVRLHIYPDGGVARFRIYGEVRPNWKDVDSAASIDLFALENGGRALLCNDEHFGSMHNLNLPGHGVNMGDGWETARRRVAGNDWVVIALGHAGVVERIEIDTAHFKGNYPDSASLQAAALADPDITMLEEESRDWPQLLSPQTLGMDAQHVFVEELAKLGVVSHIRLSIFPDGGVSRLRVVGKIADGETSQ